MYNPNAIIQHNVVEGDGDFIFTFLVCRHTEKSHRLLGIKCSVVLLRLSKEISTH